MFNDEKQDNTRMIRNAVLLIVVLVVGITLMITFNHKEKDDQIDTSVYLLITTVKSETIDGTAKTTNLGEDKFYKDDIGKVLDSNGFNFIIEEFTNDSLIIKLNNNLIDIYGDASCPNKICSKGSTINLNGSKTITLMDKNNNYSYTIYFQKKK